MTFRPKSKSLRLIAIYLEGRDGISELLSGISTKSLCTELDKVTLHRARLQPSCAAYPRVCDLCGRPLRSKRNLQERCGSWSGADMCPAFDAAITSRGPRWESGDQVQISPKRLTRLSQTLVEVARGAAPTPVSRCRPLRVVLSTDSHVVRGGNMSTRP